MVPIPCFLDGISVLVSQVGWMVVLECSIPSVLFINRDLCLYFYIIPEEINSVIVLPESSGLYLL